MNKSYIVMGVSGCGKTTIARLLADGTGGIFLDADDFHPAANKAKMAAGIPLIDDDRWPWLMKLNEALKNHTLQTKPVFLACSALKQIYRDLLAEGVENLRFIFLRGSRECLLERLNSRENHFMPAALLDSQLATLEEPSDALILNIKESIPSLVEKVLVELN